MKSWINKSALLLGLLLCIVPVMSDAQLKAVGNSLTAPTGTLPPSLGGLGASNGGPLSLDAAIYPPFPSASLTSTSTLSGIYNIPGTGNVTVTYGTSALSGAQPQYSYPSGTYPANLATNIGFWGTNGLVQRNVDNPRYYVAQSVLNQSTLDNDDNFIVSFWVTDSQFDIINYDSQNGYIVFVNNIFVGSYQPYLSTGTAQSGSSSSTIKLGSGESSTTNIYNTCYVALTGGTGAGQVRQVTAFNGSTKVANISQNWNVTPDNTSTYQIVPDQSGIGVPSAADGSIDYLNFNFATAGRRLVTIITPAFMGINITATGSISPASPLGSKRLIVVGDSDTLESGGPLNTLDMVDALSFSLGVQAFIDASGSTGWVATASGAGLNFLDRVTPPAAGGSGAQNGASFAIFGPSSASGGNFTLSVTYAGNTQTTGNIAYNAISSTIQTDLNALSNVPSNNATVGGNLHIPTAPLLVLLHNMPGAAVTMNSAGLTSPAVTPAVAAWKGVVAPMVPVDGNVNPEPFDIYIQGSANDNAAGATALQIQTNAVLCAQNIVQRFPTARVIYSGIVSYTTQAGTGVIGSGDLAFNAAIQTGAMLLPRINGNIPFINTYPAGIGGNSLVFGSGSVANPTTNKNDILISALASGHFTGNGHAFWNGFLTQKIKALEGAQ
jgi:hypothetical protein